MMYEEWRELYFPAFWYALGKTDAVVHANEFANWYVERAESANFLASAKEIPPAWEAFPNKP